MNKNDFVLAYVNLLVSGNAEAMDNFCANNKKAIIPRSLYKYTAITDYSVSNLIQDKLCFNNPRCFNDPLDCWYRKEQFKIRFSDSAIHELNSICSLIGIDTSGENFVSDESINNIAAKLPVEKREIFIETVKKHNANAANNAYNIFNHTVDKQIRITCLTENPPTQILMWSHYGDYHKGMCLEYDFTYCEEEIFQMLMPISYVNKPLQINCISTDNSSYQECNVLSSILIKASDWAYEKEWRLIKCLNEPSDDKYFHTVPFLKSICIGACTIDNALTKNIISFANAKNIPVTKAIRRDDSFQLSSTIINTM